MQKSNIPALTVKLREMARAKGPDAKLPTLRGLCEVLDSSQHAVEEALEALEIQSVIVRKQGSGIYVSPRIHRKTIAVVFNSHLLGINASPFWGLLLSHFAVLAEVRGLESNQDFEFFMTPRPADPHGMLPDHVMRMVQAGAVNGVVGISLSNDSAQWLLDKGVPCTSYAGWSKWTVVTDSELFVQAGFQALADQGCRRVEYWGLPSLENSDAEWYEHTRRAVETAYRTVGLDPARTLVGPAEDLWIHSRLPDGQQPQAFRAYSATKALFGDKARPKPDGIFIADDAMANGVLLALLEVGVRVGHDVKIVSQANRNSPILFGAKQQITLLEYDPAEIAGSLIDLLDQAMADPDLPETQISIPWRVRLPDAGE